MPDPTDRVSDSLHRGSQCPLTTAVPTETDPGGRWRVLILGGTTEAAALAAEASMLPGLHVISSLAGRTRTPADLPGTVRVGGFGGADGMAVFLRTKRIDLLVDATHPHAARISANAGAACATVGVPRLMLTRPVWSRRPGDRWLSADGAAHAATLLPAAATVLLTIGRQELSAFVARPDCRYVVRLIEPPSDTLSLPGADLVFGRGPFQLDQERALLRDHGVDCLIAKNSGGAATYAKIQAARDAGLPVIMIGRPTAPNGARVGDVPSALDWIQRAMTPAL